MESLLIAAQNNTIRTNYVKAKIENTLEDIKWKFSGKRRNSKSHKKGIQETGLSGEDVLLGIVQVITIWPYIYAPTRNSLKKKQQILCDFKIKTHHSMVNWRLDAIIIIRIRNKDVN